MNVGISSIRTKDMRVNRNELINELQKHGYDVTYIGRECENTIHPDYEKYDVSFASIPLRRINTNPIKEIKVIKETKKVINNAGVEALIAYGIRTFPTIVIASKLAGVKKILCVVNGSGRLFELKGLKGLLVKSISYPMLWVSFFLCNNILFQNPDDLKMVKSKGLLWRKNYGIVNGSGVNLEEYPFQELESKPNFSMISRLTGSKGVNDYVKAARKVKELYSESSFYLIGPMDNDDSSIDLNELENAIEEGIIKLINKVEDVRPYISQCRIFVLPSYYPEGVPRSILEAMSMGRPIITTDSPGCRETVIDGYNGFLVKPQDAKELEEKMIWMIRNNKRVEEMGKKSRKLCENKFDVNNINSQMINKLEMASEINGE